MTGIVLELTDAELFTLIELLRLELEYDKYSMDDDGTLTRLSEKVKQQAGEA